MKFSCEKNLLVSAISVASRTVAMKSAIPALEGIYIRAGVKVMLSGYNLETGITVGVVADIRETGEAIFPARLFFDIVRKLPDDTVEVSVDENFKVSIRGGISSFSITAMSAEDYPELPDVESEKGVVLPQKQLKEMISGTIFAVSENQARRIRAKSGRSAGRCRAIVATSSCGFMPGFCAEATTSSVNSCADIFRIVSDRSSGLRSTSAMPPFLLR